MNAQNNSISYDGFQVARGEFFSHIYEPSLTLYRNKVYVNAVCIRQLPEYDYIQILVNPEEKKLAIRPCPKQEKDSFRWCSDTARRTPRKITCHIFFEKIMSLMNWNCNCRYHLLGKLLQANGDLLFIFDLNSAEIYRQKKEDNGSKAPEKTPIYQKDSKHLFGLPAKEHQKTVQVPVFDEHTAFRLPDQERKSQDL